MLSVLSYGELVLGENSFFQVVYGVWSLYALILCYRLVF